MGIKQVFAVASAAFVSLFVADVATADDPLKMTASDASSGLSSFTKWNVSGGGTDAPTSDHDYLDEKYVLRTPNSGSTFTFNGKSLQLGTTKSGDAAVLAICRNGNTTVNFANDGVKLVQGRVQPYNLVEKQYTFTGACDIQAPAATPFEFWLSYGDNKNNTYVLSATLRGEKGKGLLICERAADSSGKFILAPTAGSDFAGTIKVGGKAVSEPYTTKCELRGSPTLPCTLWATSYAELIPQNGSTKWTVGSLQLDDDAIFGVASTSDQHSTMTVTDKISIGKNVVFRYSSTLSSGSAYDIPFLTKAPNAKGDLPPENFVETTRDTESHECLPRWWFVPEVAQDGSETLYYRQNKVIEIKGTDSNVTGEASHSSSSLTNLTAFQDKALPHSGIDYVLTKRGFAGQDGASYQGYRLITPEPADLPNGVYDFGGESLTIGTNCAFKSMATVLKIKSLRLMGDSQFFPRINDSTPSSLEGDELFVGPVAKNGNGVRIQVYGNLVWTCDAAVTGSGVLRFIANASGGKPAGTVVLSETNDKFYGRIEVSATSWDGTKLSSTVNECVKVSDARQLGGALAAFTADALKLESWGTLEATDDVDFSTANRGVTIGNYGQMRVASGKTLTIGNKVTLNGELHKAGTGTLAFGAAADVGTGAKLVVDAGAVQANVATAFAGVDVSFANGTALLVDTTKDFGAKGVDLSGTTTAVKIRLGFAADEAEHELSAYPLCTVPVGVAVTVARPKRHFVKLTTKSNGDGTVTYLADVGVTGAAIILR